MRKGFGEIVATIFALAFMTGLYGGIVWLMGRGLIYRFREAFAGTPDWTSIIITGMLCLFLIPCGVMGGVKLLETSYFPLVRPIVVSILGNDGSRPKLQRALEWVFSLVAFIGVFLCVMYFMRVWNGSTTSDPMDFDAGDYERETP